jgi:hypothetical protein
MFHHPRFVWIHVTFNSLKKATGRDIVQALSGKGRTRYKYAENGTGCRFWCGTILQGLTQEGYIQAGALESFQNMIATGHALDPVAVAYPVPSGEGVFY